MIGRTKALCSRRRPTFGRARSHALYSILGGGHGDPVGLLMASGIPLKKISRSCPDLLSHCHVTFAMALSLGRASWGH